MKLRPGLPLVVALVLAGSGCATMPTPLAGQFSTLLPAEAASGNATGERVRWGGSIVKVDTHADRSCFEIVGTRVGGDGRPARLDRSEGRFIACRGGFYDPEVFSAGREVTVTGTVTGFQNGRVGEYDYRYPTVAADVVYLWPVRQDTRVIVERVGYGWW
jgi:outer membrane lipoprotein